MGLSKTERDKKVAELLEYHRPTFDRLGIKEPAFYGKTPFRSSRNGVQEEFISLYERELTNTEGFYLEFAISQTYEPMEPEKRTLWKWTGNENSKNEYQLNTQFDNKRWFVPVSELIRVERKEPGFENKASGEYEEALDENEEDVPYSKMTIRDHIAILYKKPVSKREWLNKLITNL